MTMRRRKEDEWYEDAVREIDEHRKDPGKWEKYIESRVAVVLDNWRKRRANKPRKSVKSSPN